MSIWDYSQIKNLISSESQLTLKEGNTPLKTVSFEDQKILIKEEFKNPTGSFKDRSLAFVISRLKSKNINHAVISSSGNAAISAAHYSKLARIELDIFVSNDIEEKKLEALNSVADDSIIIHQSDKPKSDAIQFARENNLQNLRGSQDEDAVVGFKTIAYELYEQNSEIDAIFIPCSSGTSAVGIYLGYMDIQKDNPAVKIPAIHVCQTEKIFPIAIEFDTNYLRHYSSLAPAISDRIALRKNTVVEIVKRTNGWGWIISNEKLKEAQATSQKMGIEFSSYNSVLSLAGFLKSKEKGDVFKSPCLIYSGT